MGNGCTPKQSYNRRYNWVRSAGLNREADLLCKRLNGVKDIQGTTMRIKLPDGRAYQLYLQAYYGIGLTWFYPVVHKTHPTGALLCGQKQAASWVTSMAYIEADYTGADRFSVGGIYHKAKYEKEVFR